MLGRTHLVIGVAMVVAADGTVGFVQPHSGSGLAVGPFLCLGLAMVGSLAPDIDAEASVLRGSSRILGLVSTTLRGVGLTHRGLTHSGLAALMVMLLSLAAGGWLGGLDLGLAFGLGYAGHIIADAATVRGVPLLWPRPGRFHLLPRSLRVRTGGTAENVVLIGLCLGLLPIIPLWLAKFG